MDFTVEGKVFRAVGIQAKVLATTAGAPERAAVIPLGEAGMALRMPDGKKGWQRVVLRFSDGVEASLPLPESCSLAAGDVVALGCIGPVARAREGQDKGVALEVYAVSSPAAGVTHAFADAPAAMKLCGLTRAAEYAVEKYPLKKVCKVSAIVFLVGLACFGLLMHLFTENMDELAGRLPEVLLMSAKFGGVSALVVALGGGLYMKSSNDYNRKKAYEAYARQFEQAMDAALPQALG